VRAGYGRGKKIEIRWFADAMQADRGGSNLLRDHLDPLPDGKRPAATVLRTTAGGECRFGLRAVMTMRSLARAAGMRRRKRESQRGGRKYPGKRHDE
jgi:hypothetical protein